MEAKTDWYERRHKLMHGQVFKLHDGDIVMLDRQVAGDATKWFVYSWYNGGWSCEDATIEPGDLFEQLNAADYQIRRAMS